MHAGLAGAVNFDDRGAFIASTPATRARDEGHGGRGEGSSSRDAAASFSNGGSGGEGAALSPFSPSPLTFESFLGLPRGFVAHHALRTRTETTLLLELTRLAIEMDAILDYTMEQLEDRQLLRPQGLDGRPTKAAAAALETTVLVLQRQAEALNARNLEGLLVRMQRCLDQLADLRFPLAQCIEANLAQADELESLQVPNATAASRRMLARVEELLLHRLESLQDPTVKEPMSPLRLPPWRPEDATRVCWPRGSHGTDASSAASNPSRHEDEGPMDVRLSTTGSSNVSSSVPCSVPSSTSSSAEVSSSAIRDQSQHEDRESHDFEIHPGQTEEAAAPTPQKTDRRRDQTITKTPQPLDIHSSSSNSSSNGGGDSNSSDHLHSQPGY